MFDFILVFSSYLISIIMYLTQRHNLKYKNGYLLATKMSYDLSESYEVKNIVEVEKKRRNRIFIFTLFIPLVIFIAKSELFTMYLFIFYILLVNVAFGISTYYSMKDLRKLKSEIIKENKNEIYIDLSSNIKVEKKRISRIFYLVPILILLPSIFRISPKDISFSIFLSAFINVAVLLWGAYFIRRSGLRVYRKNSEENIKLNLENRIFPEKLGIIFASILALITDIILYFEKYKTSFLLLIIFLFISLIFVVIFFIVGFVKESKIDDEFVDSGDDYYDIFGYNNPEDPRVFVPSKLQIGNMEVNRGSKRGKSIFYGSYVIILLLLVAVGYFLTPVTYRYDFKSHSISIHSKLYHDEIVLSEIESVELLREFPKVSIMRINGTAIKNEAYGSFQMEGIGHVRLYIYKDVKSVIHVKAKGENFYFNDKTENLTKELYESLKKTKEERK